MAEHTDVFGPLKSLPGWLLGDNFFVAERIRVYEISGAKHGSSKSGFSQFSADLLRIFFCRLKWEYAWVLTIGVPNFISIRRYFREYRPQN